jgi:GNAT superfamily N-acetyltransferase
MIIKYYTREEAKKIMPRLLAAARAAKYDNAGIEEMSHIFVAHPDFFHITKNGLERPVAGFGGLVCYRGYWCLRTCVVIPQWRGGGTQRRLIRARLRFLVKKGAKHVNVWAKPENVWSLNNLVAEGFRFVPEKPREFNGAMHVKLRKML